MLLIVIQFEGEQQQPPASDPITGTTAAAAKPDHNAGLFVFWFKFEYE
jgi:hypothetical protein